MATVQSVVKFTSEDYRTAPEDKRYELLDGDLLLTPAQTVWIHCPSNGSLEVAHTFGRGQTLRSPLRAGFELHLEEVFA